MSISMRKVCAVVWAKSRALTDKNIILAPLMILGITVGLRYLYGAMMEGEALSPSLMAMVLNLGLTMNITMTGMFVTSAGLAEEKEKHTLRALMTSSVNGLEFFLGSLIPPFLETQFVSILLIPVSGLSLAQIDLVQYVLVTSIASITSCILGMIVGIFAKNQMSASTLTSPLIFVFMLIPVFGNMLPVFQNMSRFLFTGVVSNLVSCYANGDAYSLGLLDVTVLLGEIILAVGIFVMCYRRNGYEVE